MSRVLSESQLALLRRQFLSEALGESLSEDTANALLNAAEANNKAVAALAEAQAALETALAAATPDGVQAALVGYATEEHVAEEIATVSQFALFEDRKASGTHGGTFTSGAWQTRDLTSFVSEIPGASLSGSQITLPAGRYYIRARAPAYRVDQHKARLYNVTAAEAALTGTSELSGDSSANSSTPSVLSGRLDLVTETVLELQHRCQKTYSLNGFGTASHFPDADEIYSVVEVRRLPDE